MAYAKEQLRLQQYDAIYVSPHMDDAAFSCAGRILIERTRGARVLIVNVFGTGGTSASSGGHAYANYETRKLEELAVMRELDVDFIWLDHPELLFRERSLDDYVRYTFPFLHLRRDALQRAVHRDLLELIERRLAPSGIVYFPFGVGAHPDHRILCDVGRGLHAMGKHTVRFYDDVPYSLVPAWAELRMRHLGQPSRGGMLRQVNQLNRQLGAKFGVLSVFTWLFLFSLVLAQYLVQAVSGRREAHPGEGAPVPEELDIGRVLPDKLRIMAMYASQIPEFFQEGELVEQRFRSSDGRFIERCWTFPTFPTAAVRLAPDELAAAS